MAINVLATLVIAALAYAGANGIPLNRIAAEPHPLPSEASPSPAQVPLPSPTPVAAGPFVIDQFMLDGTTGWLLVSDCPARAGEQCTYATTRTDDGGAGWAKPVPLGGSFSPSDGGAPRVISFLNGQDGFVYGAGGAYITHDGGDTWRRAGFPAVFIGSIAIDAATVWATTYPCQKGTLCAYEVRSSLDGGRTWSAPHQLPLNFSPEFAVAFPSGLIISSVPNGEIQVTTDRGRSWRAVKSACTGNPFRGYASTAAGNELWELCLGTPGASGEVANASLLVSEDGGKSWSPRGNAMVARRLNAWLVASGPHVALLSGQQGTLVTRDSGKTWTAISPPLDLVKVFTLTASSGWAMDGDRNVWETTDGGDHWNELGTLPDRLP